MPHPLDTETLAQGAARIESDATSWARTIAKGYTMTPTDMRAMLALTIHLASIVKVICEKYDL